MTVLSIYAHGGWSLVLGLLAILIAHEMGHYVACLRYGVDATLPYFIPFPILSFAGTLGAFIRIRSPIPNRRALFDIGIAGPLAGFVVALPVLLLGALEAQIGPTPTEVDTPSLGEPLLFRLAITAVHGQIPDDMTTFIGPFGTAAWFGLFVTALNLMPVGQLDGGHATYAVLRGKAVYVSRAAFLACLGLLYLRPTWLLWCVVLFLLRRPHPPTLDDSVPLGRARVGVALVSIGVFILCFTPSPFIISWADFWTALRGLTSS
jgi:membrane-associated protease RseP (regulator of RpoE activity)